MELDGIESAKGEVTRSADPGGRRFATVWSADAAGAGLGSVGGGGSIGDVGDPDLSSGLPQRSPPAGDLSLKERVVVP